MTSYDDRDDILTDQKLHDLLKAEDEMDRLAESRRGIPRDPGLPQDEESQALSS